MNTEFFIAKKLFFDKENQNQLSKKIINIALVGIALGLVVMIISVSIVTGFKREVRKKAIGFGSHIQVVNFDSNLSYETLPVNKNQAFLPELIKLKGVRHIQVFATKPGIIKTSDAIQGVNFKGIGTDYDWGFFSSYLEEGKIPAINDSTRINDIIISRQLCNLLKLSLNDKMVVYFIQGDKWPPRYAMFTILGIYNTGLVEFDESFIIGDIKHVQRLNDWGKNQVSGFEIQIDDYNDLFEMEFRVRDVVINYNLEPGNTFRTMNIARKYPQIFDWLSILDVNVLVILTLMVIVAGINMVSGLFVLILERSNMIGTLKSLGSPDWSIRKVFLYLSAFLILRGLFWGNVIGIVVLILQKYLGIIGLNPETYYVDTVPVNFSLILILLINAGAMAATLLMLIIPSYFVSKISPDKTMRFD